MRCLGMLFVTLVLGMLAACSTTELLSVSKESDAAGHYQKVLVMAVSQNAQIRQIVEQSLADNLDELTVGNVVASLHMPGALDKNKPEEIRPIAEKAVKDAGADAVLVTVLLHEDVRQDYVPPRNDLVAVGNVPYFMGYGTYVGYHYETVYTPGYVTSRTDYYVQTMLFDANTGKAVWRAQSRTTDPSSLASGVSDFSDEIIGRLRQDGMI